MPSFLPRAFQAIGMWAQLGHPKEQSLAQPGHLFLHNSLYSGTPLLRLGTTSSSPGILPTTLYPGRHTPVALKIASNASFSLFHSVFILFSFMFLVCSLFEARTPSCSDSQSHLPWHSFILRFAAKTSPHYRGKSQYPAPFLCTDRTALQTCSLKARAYL